MTSKLNTNELISPIDLERLNEAHRKIDEALTAASLLYTTSNPLLSMIAEKWSKNLSELRHESYRLSSRCNDLD